MRKYIFPLGRLVALSVILVAIVATAVATVFFALKSKSEPTMENTTTDSFAAEQSAAEPSVAAAEIDTDAPPAEPTPPSHEGKCSAKDKLVGLEKSKLPQLRRLGSYQSLCGSFAADRMMYFIGFPTSASKANSMAVWIAPQLKDFHARGVTPIIIMEPTNGSGANVRLADIASGSFDSSIETLFAKLKTLGVTEDMIGIWVPYPEINLPEWNAKGFSPSDFPKMVNGFSSSMRKRYPNARISVLLNASTYGPNDTDYVKGSYADFDPFVDGIRPGSIQSFGLQGFPWRPENGTRDRWNVVPSEFLRTDLATSAAKRLGLTSIWINTGSFASMYSGKNRITASIAERATILNGIVDQASALRSQGFDVTVNIFAENKSRAKEETDWSYGNPADTSNKNRSMLFSFIEKADSLGIGLSFFDL